MTYFVDRMFRTDSPISRPDDASIQAESSRIFANILRQKETDGTDAIYLGKLVAARTGLSQPDADKRVSQAISDATQTEDTARQTASRLLFWVFLALLVGAFSASYAATIGGRQRDHVKAIH
jgi:hypothetical protein